MTTVSESERKISPQRRDTKSRQPKLPASKEPDKGMNEESAPRKNSLGKMFSSPFMLSMLSGLLLWAAFPPLNLFPLAWVAPIGWLLLIQKPALSGRRPLLQIWLAAFIHCMLVYQFIRLPHWSAYLGWVALSFYLAFYAFAFVVISRVAVQRLKLSLVIVAPVVWVGLELFRGHFLTGLSLALLAHTQVHWLPVIQISDLAGAYAVSFLIMFVAACFVRSLLDKRGKAYWPLGVAGCALIAVLAYGYVRGGRDGVDQTQPPLRVALVQGSIDTVFPDTQEEWEALNQKARQQYYDLSIQARTEGQDLDLIIWPETMFQMPDRIVDERFASLNEEDLRALQEYRWWFARNVRQALGTTDIDPVTQSTVEVRPPITSILGLQTQVDGTDQHMNSATLIDGQGNVVNRYHKMHRVVFGEYIPFGKWFPWLYNLAPIENALTAGERPEAFVVNGLRISPSVCFESIVPHLIRRQVAQLEQEGHRPDVLLNVTNDGWFWGSSLLDLHLTCNAFRAVELRRPLLVCANTGFSAQIDAAGRVIKKGPRQNCGVLLADVRSDQRRSLYQHVGDWPAGICLLATAFFSCVGGWKWLRPSGNVGD